MFGQTNVDIDVVYLDVVAKSLGQTINFQVGDGRKKIIGASVTPPANTLETILAFGSLN